MASKFKKGSLTGKHTAGLGKGDVLENISLGVVGTNIREELEKSTENIQSDEILIEKLLDNPYQYLARQTLDPEATKELATSIKENSFYGALLARPAGENYELAYGHRRREAAKLAGLTALPVKVINLTDEQMARIMASENFSRENLTPLGEANVVGLLSTAQNLSANQIAGMIGKNRRWVEYRIELYNAPDDIKAMTEARHDTLGYVGLLKKVEDLEIRAFIIKQVVDKELNRSQLEALIKETKTVKNVKSVTTSPQRGNSENLNKLAEILKNTVESSVNHFEVEVIPTIKHNGKELQIIKEQNPSISAENYADVSATEAKISVETSKELAKLNLMKFYSEITTVTDFLKSGYKLSSEEKSELEKILTELIKVGELNLESTTS
jgi:ParB family transcriptional regulator, chromosome partitioning protein